MQYGTYNKLMDRVQKEFIIKDLDKKMVFVAGPRQVGKTTLSKSLQSQWPHFQYLNFDSEKDRLLILRQEWDRKVDLVILDEVHKLKKWKTKLKGIYDTEGIRPRLLVTGSARLDVLRKGGDSLAGRYFFHRLYPFSVRELRGQASPQELLDQLMRFGGFPEPFFSQSETSAARWRKLIFERIIRADIMDLEPIRDICSLILLLDLLRERVGSPVSYNSLARDLEVSPHTVKRWIEILENLYIVFRVTPYHRNIARAVLKEPKIYFYDTGSIHSDPAKRLENVVAVCLIKHLHFLEDIKGKNVALHYLRDKEKREVDFVMIIEGKKVNLIEVKLSEEKIHQSLNYYVHKLKGEGIQLVYNLKQARSVGPISVVNAAQWLDGLDL